MKALRLFLFFCLAITASENAIGQTLKDSIYEQATIVYSKTSEDWEQSLQFLDLSNESINQLYSDNPQFQGWVFEVMAYAYYKLGDYNQSEYYATKGLEVSSLENTVDSNGRIMRLKDLLGILQKSLGRFELTEELYLEALSFAPTIIDSIYVINNLGNFYRDIGEFEKAIKWYETGLLKVPQLDTLELHQEAKLLGNLGSAQYRLYPLKGKKNLEKAYRLANILGDPERKFSVSRHLSLYYASMGDSLQANDYARESIELSRLLESPKFKREALGLIILLNKSTPELAKEYKILNDSITQAENKAANRFSLQKYDKEVEVVRRLETENKNQLLILSLIILALLFGGIYLFLINRSKQKQTQAVFTTEQRIASEIHDGVANDIFQTISKIQSQEFSKEEVLEDLDAIYNDTRDISKANQGIEPEQDYALLISDLLVSFQTEELKIISKDLKGFDWGNLRFDKREALYKVLRELLINTRKHSNTKAVVVGFEKQNSRYRIHYKDNGTGAQISPKGGLRHAESRIEAVQGRITFETSPNSGVMVLIEL